MIFLLWIPFVALLWVYCLKEKQQNFTVATALKVALSALISAIAVVAAILLKDPVCYLIALGMVFAVPADYFLQYIRSDLGRYRWGILFFGAMHVCLLAAFFAKWGIHWQEFALCAALLVVLSAFQRIQKWDLGKPKGQLSAYTVLVAFMASKAMSIYLNAPSAATAFLGAAGLLFFVSDVFLGIWDYYKDRFVYLACNRILYFTGQMCFSFFLLFLL